MSKTYIQLTIDGEEEEVEYGDTVAPKKDTAPKITLDENGLPREGNGWRGGVHWSQKMYGDG